MRRVRILPAVPQKTDISGGGMINNIKSNENRRALSVSESVVYDSSVWGWTYSHHASLAYFKNRYYAMWSNGRVNEDDIGQRVLMAVSDDCENWSEPAELFPPVSGNGVLTAAGFYVRDDGIINAYAGLYYYPESVRPEGDRNHIGTTLLCKTSPDGCKWSEATDLGLPIIPNQGPHRLMSGRLIIDGNITFPWTDDPRGIEGWTLAGIPPCPVDGLQDDSEGFNIHADMRGDVPHVCEGSHFQTDDGCIYMLLRNTSVKSAAEKCLCLSKSFDNGETYTEPEKLPFTDNCSKFYCMRLGNGKYAVIGNPDQKGRRCPLSVLLSDDAENFDTRYDIATREIPRKFEGMYKGGVYGYPHAIEVDGKIHVICSINKEDVRVFTFSVSDLK